MVTKPLAGQLALDVVDDALLDELAATFVNRLNAIADKTKPQPAPKPKPAPRVVQPPLVRPVPTPNTTTTPPPVPAGDQLAKLHEAKEATLARLELIYRQIAHLEAKRAG